MFKESSRPNKNATYVLVGEHKTIYLINATLTEARAVTVKKYCKKENYILWKCSNGSMDSAVGFVTHITMSGRIEWFDSKTGEIVYISSSGHKLV